jgi:hypothetical protein
MFPYGSLHSFHLGLGIDVIGLAFYISFLIWDPIDLFGLLLNEWGVRVKTVCPAPPPEYMLQQESHKGKLETSGKMPARNPADKVHYIICFKDWVPYPFSDFGTGRSPNGSGGVNSIIDACACWHSSLPSPFRAYPKENPSWS